MRNREFGDLGAMFLLDLDYAFPGAGFDFIHPGDDLAGKLVERLGVCRAFAFENGGFAAVSGFADVGIELDVPQERNLELLRCFLSPAAGENIDLVTAMRADEVAHVLDHAYDIHLHLAKHFDGLAGVL